MTPLIRVANNHQDAAARVVAHATRALTEQEQRYELLQQFRDDYSVLPASEATLTSPALLANRQAFRERLDAAVQEQAGIVESSRQRCEVDRVQLINASRQKKVLESLAASYKAAEHKVEEGRAQRVMDDLGARRTAARPSMTEDDSTP